MILDDVFYLLDIDETPLRALPLTAEYKLEDLQDSTNQLELRLPFKEAGRIVTDQEIVFRGRRFSILGLGFDKDTKEIILTCEELQARLADANIPTYTLKDKNLPEAMQQALAKAPGWTVGDVFETTLNYNAELKNVSSLFALRFLERQSGGRLYFESGRKKVHILKVDERIADVVFQYAKNIANIVKEQTSPQATVIYPYGRDGMTIEAIAGKTYIENFSWYTNLGMTIEDARAKFTKELVWEDDRYIYNVNLYRDAETRLSLLSQPQINYKLEKASAEGVELGMMAYVYDEDLDIRVRVAVVKLIRSSNPEENEIELDYMPPSLGATIDNEFSGDTNTGQTGETSFFLKKNQSDVAISSTETAIVEADITVYSATAFEMGLSVMVEVTNGGVLEGYFRLDGDLLPTEIKQTVSPGWYTFGLPFIVTGIQEGTKTLRFYMKFSGGGSARISKERAEFYVKASGVYGGDTNDKPDRTVVENVAVPELTILVADNVIEFIDLPRRFNPIENVLIPVPDLPVTDQTILFFDPSFEEVYPPEITVTRNEFGRMSDFSGFANVLPQVEADNFLDFLHYEKRVFKTVTLGGSFVYMIATDGTFIVVDEIAKIISSDGNLYTADKTNLNYYRGRRIDWSAEVGELVEMETYKRAADEIRVPGYLYGYSTTPGSGVLSYDGPNEVNLIGKLFKVFPGSAYHLTRSASDQISFLFMERDPQLVELEESFGFTAEEQDPESLEIIFTAPDNAEYLFVYLSAAGHVPEVQLIETARPVVIGEQGEKYVSGYSIGVGTNVLTFTQPKIGKAEGVIYPVTGDSYYIFDRNETSDAFRVLFLNEEPLLDGTDQTFNSVTENLAPGMILQAPADAIAVFIQYTESGEASPVVFAETDEPPKTGVSLDEAIPIGLDTLIDYEVNAAVHFRYFKLSGLTIGSTYRAENFDHSSGQNHDTYMFLFDGETKAQIGADDDGGDARNFSRISWTADKSEYYIGMRAYSTGSQGYASIRVIQI